MNKTKRLKVGIIFPSLSRFSIICFWIFGLASYGIETGYGPQKMYLEMMRASEEAIRILIQAQQECEEMYVNGEDTELAVIELRTRDKQ